MPTKVIGSKDEVWDGIAVKTSGGLTKAKLAKNKQGRIVSKKKQEMGREIFKRGFLKRCGPQPKKLLTVKEAKKQIKQKQRLQREGKKERRVHAKEEKIKKIERGLIKEEPRSKQSDLKDILEALIS